MIGLNQAMRIVALLVACAGTFEYFALGEFIPAPFGVALILVTLSLATSRWERSVARTTLAISSVIPIAAIAGAALGIVPIAVPIFDSLVFGWLFSRALAPAKLSLKTT